jgi:hypothetical protein
VHPWTACEPRLPPPQLGTHLHQQQQPAESRRGSHQPTVSTPEKLIQLESHACTVPTLAGTPRGGWTEQILTDEAEWHKRSMPPTADRAICCGRDGLIDAGNSHAVTGLAGIPQVILHHNLHCSQGERGEQAGRVRGGGRLRRSRSKRHTGRQAGKASKAASKSQLVISEQTSGS